MSTLPKAPIDPSLRVSASVRTANRRRERRLRIAKLRNAVDKMAMRLAESEHSAGLWAGFGDAEKSNRYRQAVRRRRFALWRLLDALESEANR